MQPILELSRLGKTYATPRGKAVIVRDVDLRVFPGEFVCLIGHSGCGKSTILSIVMGLVEPSEGGAILAGREVSGPGIDRGVVFQSACLLPWLDAASNVGLAVEQRSRRIPSAARRRIAEEHLARFGLGGDANRYPGELSAGMRQRVGIARALALEPMLLLFDEPFSLLDPLTRIELQDELLFLLQRDPKTVLMVTHDVDEALYLADRIVMMTSAPAATIGETLEVPFRRPRNRSAVLGHPEYFRLRDRVIGFLERSADPSHAA